MDENKQYKRIQAAARKYSDSEDIAQQAFEIWLRRSSAAAMEGRTIAFIPDNLCIDAARTLGGELRKKKVHPKFVTLSENIPYQDAPYYEERRKRKVNFSYSTSDPNYKTLGIRMKLVAALFYLKGLTASEVAAYLNKTRNYVNGTLHIFRSLLTNPQEYKEAQREKNRKFSDTDKYREYRRRKYHEKKARLFNRTNPITRS